MIRTASDVSVVAPARNEEASLPALLEALEGQTCPAAELIVIDAASEDRTRKIALGYSSARLVDAGPAFPGAARNRGAVAARQPWVAFVDCGCVPQADWLEALVAARDAAVEADVVYGDYDPAVAGEWDAAQALVIVSPRDPATGCRPPSIASSLVRREMFLKVGGFPENLRAAEDLLFFETLEKAGAKVVHAPRARIRWTLARSPRAVFRRLRLYSAHHAAAGLGRTWHHRVLAMNAVGLALLVAGFVWPLAWALLGLGALARLWRTVMSRRSSAPPEAQRLTAGRWARAAVLLAVADAACVLGYLDYLRGRVATSPQ